MKTIKIGLLGCGTVGAGVINLLEKNYASIVKHTGCDIKITHCVVKDLNKSRDCNIESIKLSTDPLEIINNDQIDIIVELIGGVEPTHELVLAAIEKNKAIVSANKALLALHGDAIFKKAYQKGLPVLFEAAVAGAIPIIKLLRESLASNTIERVMGILNGTGNFILSAMSEEQASFSDTLIQAQKLGYAEAEPSFDIDGIDVAHKLCILAGLAFNTQLAFDKIFIEGIRNITLQDIIYAEELGYKIKPLGIAEYNNNQISLRVHPCLLQKNNMLAHVNGVTNAVCVDSDAAGMTIYSGPGAGAAPTASAVVADIIDVVKMLAVDTQARLALLPFNPNRLNKSTYQSMADISCAYYLRLQVTDKPGVLAEITQILANKNISIEVLLQKDDVDKQGCVPIVMITHICQEQAMQAAIAELTQLNDIHEKPLYLRLES